MQRGGLCDHFILYVTGPGRCVTDVRLDLRKCFNPTWQPQIKFLNNHKMGEEK